MFSVLRHTIPAFIYKMNVPQALTVASIMSAPLLAPLFIMNDNEALLSAQVAVIYFILAFGLYPFLLSIRYMRRKPLVRKRLVRFTRGYIRFHMAFSILGFVFICVHIVTMGKWVAVSPLMNKGFTGLLAVLTMLFVLLTGYWRKKKSSGKRRRFHRYTAILFLCTVMIHVLV